MAATLKEQREAYCSSLAEALEQIVAALASDPNVERAILFGSYADGRRDLFTDLDVLVVMHSPVDFATRTAEMYRKLSVPVDLDLLVYTPEEIAQNQDRGIVRQALEKGSVIYEKPAA